METHFSFVLLSVQLNYREMFFSFANCFFTDLKLTHGIKTPSFLKIPNTLCSKNPHLYISFEPDISEDSGIPPYLL